MPDRFVFVAGGDMIGPDHVLDQRDKADFDPVARLFLAGDLGFANQEGAILDPRNFSPAAENGGGYPAYPVGHARDLKASGIGAVSLANNHGTDWGLEGLVATMAALDEAGVAYAGAGTSLEAARAPGFVNTDRGRAAIVSAASTFPPMSPAGPETGRSSSRSRPGISPLHVRQIRLVTDAQLRALLPIAGPVGSSYGHHGELRIADQLFRRSDKPGLAWEMAPDDLSAILGAVRDARAAASFVLFTIHAHETAGQEDDLPPGAFEPMVLHRANEAPSPDDPRPAGFQQMLFHSAIDNGADAVVRTGPHSLGGIEIYKGRPIFYSLGFLFFDFNHGERSYRAPSGVIKHLPDIWYETVVPVSSYRAGKLDRIVLYPAMIRPVGGLPILAHGADADRILNRVRVMSLRYGTKLTIANGIGNIVP